MTYSRRLALATWLVLVPACYGENLIQPPDGSTSQPGPICQAGNQCCTTAELVCRGNPDGTMLCTCYKDWDCDDILKPEKCFQKPTDTPDGQGGWSCVVQNGKDLCTHSGGELPTGKNGWLCKVSGGSVICERPTNTPDGGGGWTCVYAEDQKFCSRTTPGKDLGVPKADLGVPLPKVDQGVPQLDTGTPVPTGWSCYKDGLGNNICTKPGVGLPPGGGSYQCYWKSGTITCEGSSGSPPGGGGWNCVPSPLVGGWKCTKPQQPTDVPGGGTWNCTSSTEQGGATCVQPPPKLPGQQCIPGQKMWCDGELYCGYGQVDCAPDGKWKTKLDSNGQPVLDCVELPDGSRPNTVCACFFFYFNQDCCETPDCIVPPGSKGQICPPSAGGYCNYCNPQKPECQMPGAKCVVTPKAETFCGQDCTGGKACPAGALCTPVQISGTTSYQCVPLDQSCYY